MGARAALPVGELAVRYQSGASLNTLGLEYGVHLETVRRHLRAAGVRLRSAGDNHIHTLGGPLQYTHEGYLMTIGRDGQRVLVHRACWEAHYGAVPAGCVIHHINEKPADNRIHNLACMSKTAHTSLHRGVNAARRRYAAGAVHCGERAR